MKILEVTETVFTFEYFTFEYLYYTKSLTKWK